MQKVDDIKPCYPLFRQDEYKDSLKNKKEMFEEGHAADKVQETFTWTTTMEYRELNFKREALTVNPAKACQPLGAVLCALGFEKTLPYVHGSQGCVAYFRTYFNRHFREPVSCVSDSMTEDAAVFGGQKNMIDGLENAKAMYKPDMIAVSTTCMAEVIGDDLNAFIRNTKKAGNIPEDFPVDRFPYVQKVFEHIATATVSNTAEHARELKYLRLTDKIVANRDDLIGTAKNMVLGMATAGYEPKRPPANLILPGLPGYSTFEMGLYNMRLGDYLTDHEMKIAKKLATVLTGGDIEPNTAVTEDYILGLEKEAFMSLVGEPKSIERMQAILSTGKPLRN